MKSNLNLKPAFFCMRSNFIAIGVFAIALVGCGFAINGAAISQDSVDEKTVDQPKATQEKSEPIETVGIVKAKPSEGFFV